MLGSACFLLCLEPWVNSTYDLLWYTALKKQHVEAKFIRYPGNYHEGWPPWDMIHRYYQETAWWQEHLE